MNKKHLHHSQEHKFGKETTSWNGAPITLQVSDSAMIPSTPTGTMLLAWYNTSKQNNPGQLSIGSGARTPISYPAPALVAQPSTLMNNWKGDNLSVVNSSMPGSSTPIWISAFGPGISKGSRVLPADGSIVVLSALQTAQGNCMATRMLLNMNCDSGCLAVMAVIGGPVDADGNNGYVIILNASEETGPAPLPPPPPGIYATTINNDYAMSFNWGSSAIFVASMSPDTTLNVSVSLRAL